MPSSREHCLPCAFREVEPTSDPDTHAIERRAVESGIGSAIDAETESAGLRWGIDDKRLAAATSCAECIFSGQCQVYTYRALKEVGTSNMMVVIFRKQTF